MNVISRMHGAAYTHFSTIVQLPKVFQFINSSMSSYVNELPAIGHVISKLKDHPCINLILLEVTSYITFQTIYSTINSYPYSVLVAIAKWYIFVK